MKGRTEGLLDLEVISDGGGLGLGDTLLAVDGTLEGLEGRDVERHLASLACRPLVPKNHQRNTQG